jgi:hypothetical protein
MTFRDDRDAMLARLDSLEDELAREKRKTAALESELVAARAPVVPDAPPAATDLVPPPRAVPLALAFATQWHVLTFAMVVFVGWIIAGAVLVGWFDDRPVVALLGLAPLAWLLVRRRRAVWLLRHGVAAPATVLETKESSWQYGDNVERVRAGWGDDPEPYGGSYWRTRVRIGLGTGPFAIRRLRGRPYEGAMFLFDAQRPRHNIATYDLPIPVRPDADGRWPTRLRIRDYIAGVLGLAYVVVLGVLAALAALP